MLLDAQDAPSNPQTLTATANSTDYIDKGAAVNLGAGDPLLALVNIGTPTGTSPTLTINLVGADDSGFSTNKITIASLAPSLTSGTEKGGVYLSIPPHAPKRYFRFEYTVGGTTPSIPVRHAGLTPLAQTAAMTN
jgi:hypothetical protein